MAEEWLSWETARTEKFIRHQSNGHEKLIGKLIVDGWCVEKRTAYQFHGYFFHGCPCNEKEVNDVKGVPMSVLLADPRTNTAYLRKFVEIGKSVSSRFHRREQWVMSESQILSPVNAGILFGLVECDIHVPPALRDHFTEMQPVFKNINITRPHIGPFMRSYAEEHDIIKQPQCSLWEVTEVIRSYWRHPFSSGIWTTVLLSLACTG